MASLRGCSFLPTRHASSINTHQFSLHSGHRLNTIPTGPSAPNKAPGLFLVTLLCFSPVNSCRKTNTSPDPFCYSSLFRAAFIVAKKLSCNSFVNLIIIVVSWLLSVAVLLRRWLGSWKKSLTSSSLPSLLLYNRFLCSFMTLCAT